MESVKNMTNLDGLKELVQSSFPDTEARFRPCAFFDERLDCIRVIARDCSVLEERINDRVTVLIDNYYPAPGCKQYVGFTIKGARHFCREQGWDTIRTVKMTELLDAFLAAFPELIVQWFIEMVARPLVRDEQIDLVEIPEGALLAA
jgi:hypothetical protein